MLLCLMMQHIHKNACILVLIKSEWRSLQTMIQQQQQVECRLQAKLKSQIIKQIFKDLGPKNLKGVQFFYLISSDEKVELQFISAAKDILITIMLKKNLFQHYLYTNRRHRLHRFALEDFTIITSLFENNKLLLDLELTEERFTISYSSPNGRTQFYGVPLSCDQDDEEFIIQDKDLRPQEGSVQVRLAKVGMLESVLSYAKGCKLGSLWFRYESRNKALEVTDKKEKHEISWQLKLQGEARVNLVVHMEVNCKMLACALNLLPNDSELIITFYEGFMLLDVPEKEKTFTIRLNAKYQINQ